MNSNLPVLKQNSLACDPDDARRFHTQIEGLDAAWCVLRQVSVKEGNTPVDVKIVAKTVRPNSNGASGAKVVDVGGQALESLTAATNYKFVSFDELDTSLLIEKMMQGTCGEKGPYTWVHIAEQSGALGPRAVGEVSILANLRLICEEMLESGFCKRHAFEYWWRFVSLETPLDSTAEKLIDLSINSVEVDGVRPTQTPSAFSIPLLPHQCLSLSWMFLREKSQDLFVCEGRRRETIFNEALLSLDVLLNQAFDIRGGLLCDPVGSGKTATIIGLIWETLDACKNHVKTEASKLLPIPATLVLSPANVHQHWIDEIHKFCSALRVLAVPTVDRLRKTSRDALASYDIVLVPYEVLLEPSYRDLASPCKPANSPRAPASAREKVAPRPKHAVRRSSARSQSPAASPRLGSPPQVQQGTLRSSSGFTGQDVTTSISHVAARGPEKKSCYIVSPSPSDLLRASGASSENITNPPTTREDHLRFGPIGNSLECFHWYRLVMDEFHELGKAGTSRADDFRRSTMRQILQSIQSTMRWGLSGTPDAFVVRLVQAARLFQCEVTPKEAPTFVEHFCRRARVQVDVEIVEHQCPISQTSAERALYLIQQRETGIIEDGLTWESSESSQGNIRQLIRCCTHFAAPTDLSESISAPETSDSLLARKRVLVEHISENYQKLLLKYWKAVNRRRSDLKRLLQSLQEKASVLRGVNDSKQSLHTVTKKINLLKRVLMEQTPPHPPRESETANAFRSQDQSHEEPAESRITVDVAVSATDAEVQHVKVEELGTTRAWLWMHESDFQGAVSPRTSKADAVEFGDPITAFVDFCHGTHVLQPISGLWALEDSLRQFATALSDYGEQLLQLLAKCEEHQKAIDFHVQVRKALRGLDAKCGREACPICMEDLTPVNTCLSHCAHAICEDCLQRLGEHFKCPICRRSMHRTAVLRVYPKKLAEEMGNIEEPELISWSSVLLHAAGQNKLVKTFVDRHELFGDAELQKWQGDLQKSVEALQADSIGRTRAFRQTWGSKFQCVIHSIADVRESDPRAKIILFLQWDDLRACLGKALSEAQVPHVVLQGTVFERTRALQRFQKDDEMVLMLLSLEDSASGTNLTCASHVFLLHPMLASTPEEACAAEAQAIGRVRRLGQKRSVHVWRFYTTCSVEESLWKLTEGSRTALASIREHGDVNLDPTFV